MMKKCKKYALLLLTIVFVFMFSVIAFADVTYKDKAGKEIVTIPDMPEEYQKKLGADYVVFYKDWGKGHFSVRYIKGTLTMMNDGAYQQSGNDDDLLYQTEYDSGPGGYNVPVNQTYKQLGSNVYKWHPSVYVPIYATQDILSYDGSVFFQPPKVPKLTAVLKMTNLGGALSEVISLMPLVLLAVTSYLALRKAYSFVLMQLRKS